MTRSSSGEATREETQKVTRSIMIVRPPGYQNNGTSATPPASPAGSTPPVSPFSGKSIMPFVFFSKWINSYLLEKWRIRVVLSFTGSIG